MPVSFGRMLPAHHLQWQGSAVALVIAVAAALDPAAGTGVVYLAGCAAAITALARGLGRPGGGFTLPWAIIPVPGFLLGWWAAGRYADRFRGRAGWRGRAGRFLPSVELIRELFACPLRWWRALAGMALFWAADAFAACTGRAGRPGRRRHGHRARRDRVRRACAAEPGGS